MLQKTSFVLMNDFIRVVVLAIFCSGCIYPRYFKGPNKIGYDYFELQDSIDISVSYMETFVSWKETHSGSSIEIKTFHDLAPFNRSRLPIEVSFDSLTDIKTKFFDLRMDRIDFSDNGIRNGNTILFSDSNIDILLVYQTKNFKKKNYMQYSETQKVWIPGFSIKQGDREYITKGFWAVYPKNLQR